MNSNAQNSDRFLVSASQVNAEGIHVWPLDPAFPVEVVQHTLSGLQPFRMNRHEYFEVVHLISGRLVWQVQDCLFCQEDGDIFFMAGPRYHRLTEQSSSLATVESLFFNPELLSSSDEGKEYLREFLTQGPTFKHLVQASSILANDLVRLIRRVENELPAETERARLCVSTYIEMILILLMEHNGPSPSSTAYGMRQKTQLTQLKPLFGFLEENYHRQISPQDAAELLNMSPSSFRRLFRRTTGQSFVEYLNQFRIAKAQELLASTDMPITEISMEVGFCDQSYFGMIFRRLTQSTPRHYRQKNFIEPARGVSLPLVHGLINDMRVR